LDDFDCCLGNFCFAFAAGLSRLSALDSRQQFGQRVKIKKCQLLRRTILLLWMNGATEQRRFLF